MCPKTKKSYVIIIEAFGRFYNTKLYQNPPLSCSPSLKLSIMQRRRSFWWQKKYLWMKSQFLSFSNTIPTIPYHFSQTPGEYQTKSLTQRPHTFFSISRKTCFHFRSSFAFLNCCDTEAIWKEIRIKICCIESLSARWAIWKLFRRITVVVWSFRRGGEKEKALCQTLC